MVALPSTLTFFMALAEAHILHAILQLLFKRVGAAPFITFGNMGQSWSQVRWDQVKEVLTLAAQIQLLYLRISEFHADV